MRIDEIIDGFIEADDVEVVPGPIVDSNAEEEDLDETEVDENDDNGEAAAAANLAQLKIDALERFAIIASDFTKLGKAYEKYGYRSKQYDKLQGQISNELMQFRFSAKQVDALCDTMRSLVEEVRGYERRIQELCVVKARMPRAHFLKTFVLNEENLDWVKQEVAGKKPYSETLLRFQAAILDQQQKMLDLQQRVGIPIKDLKEINKQMTNG